MWWNRRDAGLPSAEGMDTMVKRVVSMTFSEEMIQEPVIYRLGNEFDVVTNIFRAMVTEKEGWVLLEIQGKADEVQRAVDFLKSLGVAVDEKKEGKI
jgi:ABC-type methionine transport system ATPase subunit